MCGIAGWIDWKEDLSAQGPDLLPRESRDDRGKILHLPLIDLKI